MNPFDRYSDARLVIHPRHEVKTEQAEVEPV